MSHLSYANSLALLLLLQGSLLALQGCSIAALSLLASLEAFILFHGFYLIHYFSHVVTLKASSVECLLGYLLSLLFLLLFILKKYQILVLVCFLNFYRLQINMSSLRNLLLRRIVHLQAFRLPCLPSYLHHFLPLILLHLILLSQTCLILLSFLNFHHYC